MKEFQAPATPAGPIRRVIVFSGHMVDEPTRPEPRFPASEVAIVERLVAMQLDAWNAGVGDLAISGAARGGDIIFAEQCALRGVEVWLYLARPVEQFLEESVRLAGANWEERFETLRSRQNVKSFIQSDCLGEDREHLGVHARNNLWMIETAAALAPTPDDIRALLVWDERPAGDGPGGTSDFVKRVQQLGGEVAPPINPTKLPEPDS